MVVLKKNTTENQDSKNSKMAKKINPKSLQILALESVARAIKTGQCPRFPEILDDWRALLVFFKQCHFSEQLAFYKKMHEKIDKQIHTKIDYRQNSAIWFFRTIMNPCCCITDNIPKPDTCHQVDLTYNCSVPIRFDFDIIKNQPIVCPNATDKDDYNTDDVTIVINPWMTINLNKSLEWFFKLTSLTINCSGVNDILDKIETKSIKNVRLVDVCRSFDYIGDTSRILKDLDGLIILRLNSVQVKLLKTFSLSWTNLQTLEIDDCQSKSLQIHDIWQDMNKVLISSVKNYSGPIPVNIDVLNEALPALANLVVTKVEGNAQELHGQKQLESLRFLIIGQIGCIEDQNLVVKKLRQVSPKLTEGNIRSAGSKIKQYSCYCEYCTA